MPPDWFDEVRPSIRDGVQEVIDRHEDTEVDPPTRKFHQLQFDGLMDHTAEFSEPVPGDFLLNSHKFDELYDGELREAAQTIYGHLPEPPGEKADKETRGVEAIERALFEFVSVVLNYTGEFRYDQDAFDTAYNEQFEPRFSDREFSRFLLCLKNTTMDSNLTIDLARDLQGGPEYLGPYGVESLRIRNLDDLEETGIATHEAPNTGVLEPIDPLNTSRDTAALEIVLKRRRPFGEIAEDVDDNPVTPWEPEFDVTPIDVYPWQKLTDVIEYIATSVRRCLRLHRPSGTVGFEKGYHVVPGWETYRGISVPVTFEIDFECPEETANTHISEDLALEIPRFWENHRARLSPDHDKFQNPLARFERMFSRESFEDQLVDCVVGCETTILKGGSPGGQRYRLGTRSAVILGNQYGRDRPPEWIAEFFRTLYRYRNRVVHRDRKLPEEPSSGDMIEVNGTEYLAGGFLTEARKLYADILVEYLEFEETQGLSIDEINSIVDQAIVNHADTIRNQLFPDSLES